MPTVSSKDLRAIFQLCGEVGEIESTLGQIDHFFHQSVKILGGDTIGLGVLCRQKQFVCCQFPMMWGIDETVMAAGQEFVELESPAFHDPFYAPILERPGEAHRRRDLISDKDWYSSPWINEVMALFGHDDILGRVQPLQQCQMMLFTSRANGARPFDARQRELMDCLGKSFLWLFRKLEAEQFFGHEPSPATLAPRYARVLRELLRGRNENQMAADLDLRPRTVRTYVERIFRFFQVNSRAELMARWIPESALPRIGGARQDVAGLEMVIAPEIVPADPH
jgi:DNA-binding CsgD family transcriptional regulator